MVKSMMNWWNIRQEVHQINNKTKQNKTLPLRFHGQSYKEVISELVSDLLAPSSSLLKINHFPRLHFTEGMLVLYLLWMLCLESLPSICICHRTCSHFLKRFEITLFHLLYHKRFVSSGGSQVTKMFFPVKLRYFIYWSFLEDCTSFCVFLSKKTSCC